MSGRDTRSLSPSQQAALRERAVQAVRGGVRKTDVARTFGVHPGAVGRRLPRDKQELKAVVRSYLHRRQRQPHVVASFFDHYDVQYAAA